ncbi:FluG domain-containing protein [Beauveria brongniartii RCEF 3172]|uniref:FluG domain-containing protein n=1 Tax=Beauveria brongniartii RCEF 3172 TaxID=1081107 RepID=A0A166XRY7_9HYPO|nr:FluG domain-containing protein [Beauveria brongniartii RCEF 3172]
MLPVTPALIETLRQQLHNAETPENRGLSADALRLVWDRGNARRPPRPNESDGHKINKVRLERRWKKFCAKMKIENWKDSLKKLSYEEKGLGEAFLRYLMTDENGRGIHSEGTIRYSQRALNSLFQKYTGHALEDAVSKHLYTVAVSELTPYYGLRRKPKAKPNMGPDLFMYHIYFIWVRSKRALHIGLDDIDDVLIRHLCMWTGCRQHELLYNKPEDRKKLIQEHDDESDAYSDIEPDPLTFGPRPIKKCDVCGGVDEREYNPELQVLCWEDINIYILRDPSGNGGRDRLVATILLHWHKGFKKRVVPTWFPLIEEDIPAFCPVTYILTKAIAEGVIANEGYQNGPEPFFSTRLNCKAAFIQWKPEWMHKPVFRATTNDLGEKSDSPQTVHVFRNRCNELGKEMGLQDQLSNYCYRRGNLQTVDSNYRTSVHYHSALMNAVVQDAFLGRGTHSPMLTILNQMGLFCDEDAPQFVPDQLMDEIGPSRAVDRLEQEIERMRVSLTAEYGRPSNATTAERTKYEKIQGSLRAARQKHRRNIEKLIRKEHFKRKNDEELQNQLHSIHKPPETTKSRTVYQLPERSRVATILGNLDEDLSESEIVKRKIDAINAMTAYAFVSVPRQARQPTRQPKRAKEATTQHQQHENHSPQAAQKAGTGKIVPASRPILPKSLPLVVSQEVPTTPPPPYSSLDLGQPASQAIARKKLRESPPPCIFCGKKYTRRSSLWDHLEAHLERVNGGWVKCPACSIGCNSPEAFMAHAARSHGMSNGFRRPRVKLLRVERPDSKDN